MTDYTDVQVKVGGKLLAVGVMDRMFEARVDLALEVPDRATLRFVDEWPALKVGNEKSFKLGERIEVSLVSATGDPSEVFEGEITQLDAEFGRNVTAEFVVTALETPHRLTHGIKSRTFEKKSDGEVAKQIAQENGLKSKIEAGSRPKHEYLLQSSTDYAFLNERARAAGARWYVRNGTLHFVDKLSTTGPTMTWGENLQMFKTRASLAEAADDVEVRGWDPKVQKVVKSTQKMGDADLLVDTPLAKEGFKAAKATKGGRFHGEAAAASVDEAEATARGLARRAGAEMATARGECFAEPDLVPGTKIKIEGVGPRVSGTYVCTSVSHIMSGGAQYVSRFECGGADGHTLVDLLGSDARTRRSGTASWADRGLVIGTVSDTKDPEHLGRVKVRYPSLSDEVVSAWARVMSVGAGGGRGMRSTPEVGDEVLLGFEHGDPRRPVVLGGMWSSKYKPPGVDDTDKVKYLTVSSLHGSEMVLKDAKDDTNQFRVKLRKGGLLELGQPATKLESETPITIQGDKDITIKATGKLVIEAQEITLKSHSKISLEAMNVAIKARATVKAEGMELGLKATGTAKLEASGLTEVKGGLLKLN